MRAPNTPLVPTALVGLLALLALFALRVHPAVAQTPPQCANWVQGPIDNGTYPNGANGSVEAIFGWDTDGAGPLGESLVIAGGFTTVEGAPASGVAMRDVQTGQWRGLGSLPVTYGGFESLTLFNGELIAGGFGDQDASDRDDNILRWDGTSWHSMGGGTSTGDVRALCVFNGVLYAAGSFTIVKTPPLQSISHIARWNPSIEDWEPLGGQLTNSVGDMVVFGSDLVVGGSFVSISGVTMNSIAKYNGSTWSPMGAGFDNGVGALEVYNGQLYAGGNFESSNGLTCGGFARWNGSNWVPANTIFPGDVFELGLYNGQMVLMGNFVHTAQNIEQYNGSAYSSIGGLGLSLFPYCATTSGGILYIGGLFTSAGATNASHLAQYDGITWLPVGGGVAGQVRAFTSYLGRLVIGGGFDESAEPGAPAHNIAGWDGVRLRNYGTGTNGVVTALKAFKQGGAFGPNELVAGGLFTTAGGVAANRIARWDEYTNIINPPPAAWSPMGAGFNNGVYAIERHNSETYAGGVFTASGATTLNRVARWNEASGVWQALGTGMNGTVYALRSFGGMLYAGGSFTTAGGIAANGLARWNGTSWSAVGFSVSGTVYSLEIHDGNLVIGGNFTGPFGAFHLATWNGALYLNVIPGGTDGDVYAMRSFGGRLHVGGNFTHVGAGIPATRAASYGDGGWTETSGGADDYVFALGDYAGELVAGGWFGTVKNNLIPSPRMARWSPTGAPWIASNPWSLTLAPGSTAEFSSQYQHGTNPVTLQWLYYDLPLSDGLREGGSLVSGSNTTTLRIQNLSGHDVGQYRLVVGSPCGADTSAVARLDLPYTTGVEPGQTPGLVTAFESVAPNPTRQSSLLTFSLERDADVRVRVHDVRGRLIRSLAIGRMTAGRHAVPWNARGAAGTAASGAGAGGGVRSGIYFLRLEVDGRPVGTKRVAVL
jgi:hypothetical protein